MQSNTEVDTGSEVRQVVYHMEQKREFEEE